MSRRCQPLDVQGRGSKTDAARSRSCGRADERGGEGEQEGREERGEADRIGRTACHSVVIGRCWLFALFPYSSLCSLLVQHPKRSWRGSRQTLLDYFHGFCLQFGTDPGVNTLCRSVQGWEGLERVWVFTVYVYVSGCACLCLLPSISSDLWWFSRIPKPNLDRWLLKLLLCLVLSSPLSFLSHAFYICIHILGISLVLLSGAI